MTSNKLRKERSKKMKQIYSTKEFYRVIEEQETVLVYWYTTWCPDCFAVKHYLPKLEEEFQEISFYKMNRDDDIELAKHLEIFGIPSFTLYREEDEIGRFVNKHRKSYEEVKAFIEKTL